MYIEGIQKLTLLDFPGYVACTVFTKGCNFKCPFCHNSSLISFPELVFNEDGEENCSLANELHFTKTENEFWELLKKRKSILEGVVITGGEPLLQKDIFDFIQKIKSEGYKVKLDTNGSNPQILQDLAKANLIDYVAMDIKNSFEKYSKTCGVNIDTAKIENSIKFLLEGHVPYEFRTTAVIGLHEASDFEKIGFMLQGAQKYFIQSYKKADSVLLPEGLEEPTKEDLSAFLSAARLHLPQSELRG